MAELSRRLPLYDDLARRFASALRGTQLYAADHPLIVRNLEALLDALEQLLKEDDMVAIGVVGGALVVSDTPLPKATATLGELLRRKTVGIERVTFARGLTVDELGSFIRAVADLTHQTAQRADALPTLPHITVGRIGGGGAGAAGIARDIATIQRLYSDVSQAAESVWDAAKTEGQPELNAAVDTVDGLADSITENRTALIALTAMKSYDNYTFTHMVNVSILTMAQARSLGIEGKLLRELGLSALMHDIGKVRTPLEILNKTTQLDDEEFAIMKRHVVDGAEILRQTPEMPILAPSVAFEHHLRQNGTGYPAVKRPTLNLGTKLCSIADVYDAMRSQRAYQQAFPTDRILAVLKRNEGGEFDQDLVRRFVQLIGIYPPGTLVRLSSGEVAVVLKVHAPDPYRPKVRVLLDPEGQAIGVPVERNLWENAADGDADVKIDAPLDPAEHGIDPLDFI